MVSMFAASEATDLKIPMTTGWDQSAAGWIAALGEYGDYARTHILDPVMKARIAGRGFASALDVGCGEGRFCRIMREHGISTVGIDPTCVLLDRARHLDPISRVRRSCHFPMGGSIR